MTSDFRNFFNEDFLDKLARETNFIQRKSKFTPAHFLNTLLFSFHQGKQLSLNDLSIDLEQQFNISISKQGIQEKFNDQAVIFMERLLSVFMSKVLNLEKVKAPSFFSSIRIKDSTRFALPEKYSAVYKGHGGATANSKAMISIQYEYDILSGKTLGLQLTSGRRNDQTDSKESLTLIKENELFIRDLGYVTSTYLKKIIESKAYFLNRLPSQVNVYLVHSKESSDELDFKKCYLKMKKYGLPYLEYDVLVGEKEKINSRLIMQLADLRTYNKRLKKTQKQAASYGHKVSEKFKIRARLNLFITNVSAEQIPASKIRQLYGLRWQIELAFKIWKSQGEIHKVKNMKIQRFQCQLIAKLIWIMINWKIFSLLNRWIISVHPNLCCSVWKYYKLAYSLTKELRMIINNQLKIEPWIKKLLLIADKRLLLETKKGQIDYLKMVKQLYLP